MDTAIGIVIAVTRCHAIPRSGSGIWSNFFYIYVAWYHSGSTRSTTFSHEPSLLATASPHGTVKIWDITHWRCLRTLSNGRFAVYSVAFSHDSVLLASTSADHIIRICDQRNGLCVNIIDYEDAPAFLLAFSTNSNWLAVGLRNSSIRMWDTISGMDSRIVSEQSGDVESVAFSYLYDSQQAHLTSPRKYGT